MRISKEHDERRNEILDTARHLFQTKGYKNCTVNDILQAVGIARGTFYYYFASKEEVMDAIVLRYTDVIKERALGAAHEQGVSVEEKLVHIFGAMRIADELEPDMLEEMHKPENALLHQKTLNQAITMLTPILVEVIEEGNKKKIWSCQYPEAYMQIFLAASMTLTDDGIFEQTDKMQQKIMVGLFSLLDKMLGIAEDSCMRLFLSGRKKSESEKKGV